MRLTHKCVLFRCLCELSTASNELNLIPQRMHVGSRRCDAKARTTLPVGVVDTPASSVCLRNLRGRPHLRGKPASSEYSVQAMLSCSIPSFPFEIDESEVWKHMSQIFAIRNRQSKIRYLKLWHICGGAPSMRVPRPHFPPSTTNHQACNLSAPLLCPHRLQASLSMWRICSHRVQVTPQMFLARLMDPSHPSQTRPINGCLAGQCPTRRTEVRP